MTPCTAEMVIQLLQHRRSLWLDRAIVGLIWFEIPLTHVQWAFGVGY